MLGQQLMKTLIATLAALLVGAGSVFSHPGHDHSHLSSSEEAAHHLSSGGFLGVALGAGVGLLLVSLRLRQHRPAAVRS